MLFVLFVLAVVEISNYQSLSPILKAVFNLVYLIDIFSNSDRTGAIIELESLSNLVGFNKVVVIVKSVKNKHVLVLVLV